jgi:hypothetical protein
MYLMPTQNVARLRKWSNKFRRGPMRRRKKKETIFKFIANFNGNLTGFNL